MFKIVNFLHLKDIGWLEMLFALYPILSVYSWGIVPLELVMPLILILIALKRCRGHFLKSRIYKPILIFLSFYIAHEIVWLFVMNTVQFYFINATISGIICLGSINLIFPAINKKKLIVSINYVAILSILGLLYHVLLTRMGGSVEPLKLPLIGFDFTRLDELGDRPSSFYIEPQAFVSFMLVPLFLALKENKLLWAGIIIISLFLSTSSTGIAISFILLLFYIFTQKVKLWLKILIIIGGIGLAFLLLSSSFFEVGMNKISNTNIELAERLVNGLFVVQEMNPSDYVLGIRYANPYDYYLAGNVSNFLVMVSDNGMFVSSFWLVIIRFGIIGLIIYLNIFFKIINNYRDILPYILCIFVQLFSNADMIGSGFLFQFIFILSYIEYQRDDSKRKNIIKISNVE
ncbi:MAG: hypothetical protein LW711_14375 [Saprospiraceae bacterium]|jgi:hypothetical protein|nr:hypothetical protein [Saprospiraceae bacterium]